MRSADALDLITMLPLMAAERPQSDIGRPFRLQSEFQPAYYQPEAYVPRTDTYVEKESSLNEQIDRMRHSATRAILERRDVVVVASVSCIYGIGSVETYSQMTLSLAKGDRVNRTQLLARFV